MSLNKLFQDAAKKHEAGELKQALKAYQRVLQVEPAHVSTLHLLGHLYLQTEQFFESREVFEKVLQLDTGDPQIQIGYARALASCGDFLKAQKVLKPLLAEADAEVWELYAQICEARLDVEPAVQAFLQVVRMQPSRLDLLGRAGCMLLYAEDFPSGFKLHRYRPFILESGREPLGAEAVTVEGQALFLRGEQGLGDELFFLRYLPYVETLSPHSVVLGISHKNRLLLESVWPQIQFREQPQPHEKVISIGDLPYLAMRGGMQGLPPPLPMGNYSSKGPVCVQWEAGTTVETLGRHRSVLKRVDPSWLGQEAKKLNREIILLQRNPQAEDVIAFEDSFGSKILDKSESQKDLRSLRGVLADCSHYLGVSSTAWHIAAGMQMPGTLCIPFPSDFRWGLRRRASVWFPSATLLRQTERGIWPSLRIR